MAQSKIQWTDKTWNPTVGCNKVSQGCKLCYAEIMHKRQRGMNPDKYSRPFLDGAFPYEPALEIPLHWRKPAMIFVNSMSDLFHENVPFEFIHQVFYIMRTSPQHIFQILTKRHERALEYYNVRKYRFEQTGGDEYYSCSIPNVWLGVSVEDQATADERIPLLLKIPAAVRWLSVEPMLGEVDLKLPTKVWVDSVGDKRCDHCCNKDRCDDSEHYYRPQCPYCRGSGKGKILDWVVCGGESGNGARPMHPDWARKLRDDCQAAGVPFFFKQWGEWGNAQNHKFSERYKHKTVAVHKSGKVTNITFDNWNSIQAEGKYGIMTKLGKKESGRILDGREWNEYPEVVK